VGTRALDIESVLRGVGEVAREAGVFASVALEGGMLVCAAKDSAEPAFYRVERDASSPTRIWVTLVMKDRWLSESIETDLVHTGDKLDELLEDELVDLGWTHGRMPFEHFRSDDLLFTFRSPVDLARHDARDVGTLLLAYEQCFRQLGDMEAGDDED
jgi:hypothetical protein